MKTGKKLFSALLAAGILMSQTAFAGIASAADTEPVATHGDYYAIYPNQDGTFTGGTISDNGKKFGTGGYDTERDAYGVSVQNVGQRLAIIHSLSNTLNRSQYKYVAFNFMYDGAATNWGDTGVGWTLHQGGNFTKKRVRSQLISEGVPNVAWEKQIINLDEYLPGESFNATDYFFIDQGGTSIDGEAVPKGHMTLNCYEKYMAFFENEEDAKAYDLSIKKYSINGVEGTLDSVAHTITYNMEGMDSSAFANAEPVITQDPLATVTKTSGDINYIDPITYSVENVLGETIEYTVKFVYSQEEEVDGQYVLKFDSPEKVSTTPLKFYNWNFKADENFGSYDASTKSLYVNKHCYGGALGIVIDKEIPDLNKYKYIKIKYKYDADNCSNSTSYISNRVVLSETSGGGIKLRDNIGYAFVKNGTVPGRWFTDIADISSISKYANENSRIRFNAGYNPEKQQIKVSYNIAYIALFEKYEDAVNYENDSAFAGISMSNVRGKSIRSVLEYYEDSKTPDMISVLYKDGKVESIVHADAPSYVALNDAGTAYEFNDGTTIDTTTVMGGVIKEDAEEKGDCDPSSFMAERTATLSTAVNTANLADGSYKVKTFVWTQEEMKPYCDSREISFTMENGTMTVIE